jgi:hypothetical protein
MGDDKIDKLIINWGDGNISGTILNDYNINYNNI